MKELQRVRKQHESKKEELFNLHREYRVAVSRNTSLKQEYANSEKSGAEFKQKQIQKMMQ